MRTADEAWVDLYWLPLGAGGHSVRFNGKVYEWLASRREHRRPCDIYHSALVVHLDGVDWTVEMGEKGKAVRGYSLPLCSNEGRIPRASRRSLWCESEGRRRYRICFELTRLS